MAESTVRSRHLGRWAIVVLVLVMVSVAIPASRPTAPAGSVRPLLTADQIPLSNITPANLSIPYPLPAAVIQIPIHVVFMGVPTSLIDTSVLAANLLSSYEPVATAPIAASGEVLRFATYNFDYSVDIVPASTANAYARWITSNYRLDIAPYWIQGKQAFPANEVGLVNATAALEYLETNLQSYLATGYTLLIVDAYHTSPSVPVYYFYESRVADIETGLDHRPPWSSYMTGFGGGPGRMMFLDLSAGPTNAQMGPGIVANETEMPPVWNYGAYESTKFSHDAAFYMDYAIMQRFVPSYFAPPDLHPSYHIQVTIYNDDPNRSFLPYLNLQAILDAYAALEPFSTFSGSVREVSLSSDTDLAQTVALATDALTSTVDDAVLMAYFKQNLDAYVVPHGTDTVVPVFLFGFSGRLAFASGAAGWAMSMNGRSALIMAVLNAVMLGELPYLTTSAPDGVTWASDSFTLSAGGTRYYAGGAANVPNVERAYATGTSWLNGTFDVTSGSVDFYLFTEYEYGNFTRGGGDPLIRGAGLSGPGWYFSLQVPAPGYYYAVFSDGSFTSPRVTFNATLETYYAEGYTITLIHEGGHFFGLAHPHEGVLWMNGEPQPYVHWFYDFTASPMSYLTATNAFDQFDQDAVLRGNALTLMSQALARVWVAEQLMIQEQVRLVPYNVLDEINGTVRQLLLAKFYLDANAYPEAVAVALLANIPSQAVLPALLADLEAAPVLRANLSARDGVVQDHRLQAYGQVFSIRNFTLEFIFGGKTYPIAYEVDGAFNFTATGLPYGTHTAEIRATDANGTVVSRSFTVTVPIEAWVWAALVAGAAAAVIAAVLLVRRRKRSRTTLPPTSEASETGAVPPALAPAGFEPPPPPPSDLPPPPRD